MFKLTRKEKMAVIIKRLEGCYPDGLSESEKRKIRRFNGKFEKHLRIEFN